MLSYHMPSSNELLKFIILFFGSAIIAMETTRILIKRFQKRRIVANINHRSMHKTPVPVGGGWAIVPLVLLASLFFFWSSGKLPTWLVLFDTLVLAVLSWLDDKKHMPRMTRLTVQAALVFTTISLIPEHQIVFTADWPLWTDRLVTGLCWLWFINLFNFMDGIDGLAGTEILFICTGLVFIGLEIGMGMPSLFVITVLAGASAGFLWWNRHPAKIFLGDVGSISIGFLLGWFLIQLAIKGYLIAAFLLPAYFIADASLTIAKRILKGEPFWEPHKTHFYQRAAMGLGDHSEALWKIIPANFGLLAFAITSIYQPLISALCGIVVIIVVLLVLQRYATQ